MIRCFVLNIIFIVFPALLLAQNIDRQLIQENYDRAFLQYKEMLNGTLEADFKKAVFIAENAYHDNQLDYELFCKKIDAFADLARQLSNTRELLYNEVDQESVKKHAAIFAVMMDTIPIQYEGESIRYLPFSYDFEDFYGQKDWNKMFVTKLLDTKSGNCHSLPYLYKILAHELGVKAYLSLAPNHIYIKVRNIKSGWYNTELTSGMFPIDAWVKSSGHIHRNAIKSGTYTDTLSLKHSIALCLIDLAQGYEKKLGFNDGQFILKACQTALEYYPHYMNAMFIKTETQRKLITKQMKELNIKDKEELFFNVPESENIFNDMQATYAKIHTLGYRKMPPEMYLKWLASLKEEKEKYQNTKAEQQ